MRVLITGDNGYIGSVMVHALRMRGHAVTGLDAMFFSECAFYPVRGQSPSPRQDIRDVTAENVRGVDAVIHLAALSNDPLGEMEPELTRDINHAATLRLARLARDAGVKRFLFASSCSLYGPRGEEEELDETSACQPLTAYAASKAQCEQDLANLADADFSPVFLRNATAYGVSPQLRLDVVLNNLTGWAHTRGYIRLQSNGLSWRPLVHVEDICAAFAAVLEAPREAVHAQAFNVGVPGQNFLVRDLARMVEELAPGCSVVMGGGNTVDRRSYRVRFDKLASTLRAFRPAWDVRRGAQELLAAYRDHALTPESFDGPRFVRLKWLEQLSARRRVNPKLRWLSPTV